MFLKFLKSIPTSVKVFFLTLFAGIVIFIILPKDNCGNVCGGGSFIPALILLLMVLTIFCMFISSIITWLRKKISTSTLIGIFILFLFSIFVIFMMTVSVSGVRCTLRWTRTMADMKQLSAVQEIFYIENDKYADTQEELIEAGIINTKFEDRMTHKELTDADGYGIEGGDENPQTWSVGPIYFPDKEINKWCRLTREGYWLSCNQDGCHKED